MNSIVLLPPKLTNKATNKVVRYNDSFKLNTCFGSTSMTRHILCEKSNLHQKFELSQLQMIHLEIQC